MKRLLIIGAGGHGKVVAEAARISWQEIFFLDDNCSKAYPYKILGSIASLSSMQMQKDFPDLVIAIGDNKKRSELLLTSLELGYNLPQVIHPTAYVSDSAMLDFGTVVFPHVVVNPYARIGRGCIINTSAIIEHDCIIGDFVHISPNATLAGEVCVGEYSWIGIGSNVIGKITIGSKVKVGAGSVVINNVDDNLMVAGVPAQVKKIL